MLTFRDYPKHHYGVCFNSKTGFFARLPKPGHDDPFWSPHGPEMLDISVTNWCDHECGTCYRASGRDGTHMAIADYEEILRQARDVGVLQVALGGGNPNQHPQFCEFLRLTREVYGIVPNYTTNGRGLTLAILHASKQYCGAVAVSAYSPYETTEEALALLRKHAIRANVHFVVSSDTINTAISWLKSPPEFLIGTNALVFLNYKPVGRGASPALVLNRSPFVEEFFQLATGQSHPFKIGFDSCLASGLAAHSTVPAVFYDGCEAGRFSMFISEDCRAYPCSFLCLTQDGPSLKEQPLHSCWSEGPAFRRIRKTLAENQCGDCLHRATCMGGCPAFPSTNVCSQARRSINAGQ